MEVMVREGGVWEYMGRQEDQSKNKQKIQI